MSIDVSTELFNDGLPGSISGDEQVISIGDVSDIQWKALLPTIDKLRVLCNIPAQPEAILDLLAFQYQVLFYDGTFNITDPVARLNAKIQLLSNNFDFHSRLGTPNVMQSVISTIYQQAIIQEWFSYGGTANHYRILFNAVLSSPLQAQIQNTQRVLKRASQAFDGFFVFNIAQPTNVYVSVGVFTQIWQVLPVGVPGRIGDFIVAGSSMKANATVQRSNPVMKIAAGATLTLVGKQLVSQASHVVIGASASMTNTAKILRGLKVLIKAGHG